jgi:hypothetical protein
MIRASLMVCSRNRRRLRRLLGGGFGILSRAPSSDARGFASPDGRGKWPDQTSNITAEWLRRDDQAVVHLVHRGAIYG